jgi:hypothetical protein
MLVVRRGRLWVCIVDTDEVRGAEEKSAVPLFSIAGSWNPQPYRPAARGRLLRRRPLNEKNRPQAGLYSRCHFGWFFNDHVNHICSVSLFISSGVMLN